MAEHTNIRSGSVVERFGTLPPVQPYWSDADLADAAAGFARASISAGTRRGYASDLRQFQRWLAGYADGELGDPTVLAGVATCPVSPATVVRFLTDKALSTTDDGVWRYAPSTMNRWLAAITREHVEEGVVSPCAHPTVTAVMSGIRREHARPPRRAAPLLLDMLRKALLATDISSYPAGIRGTRDIALLLVGWAGAFRSDELHSLRIGDVTPHVEDGVHVRVRKSKTDQDGVGVVKGLPYGQNPVTCAPCAIRRWFQLLAAAGERPAVLMRLLREQTLAVHVCREPWTHDLPGLAPLFPSLSKSGFIHAAQGDQRLFRAMSGTAMTHVIKERATAAGFNPAGLSSHSLRAGFVTTAIRAGATHSQIMAQTTHKDPATVEIYVRHHAPLDGSAITMVGL